MVVLFRGHTADLILAGHKEILSADHSIATQGSSPPAQMLATSICGQQTGLRRAC